MISKNERVIEYIAQLEAGEKVSVRKLAQVLGVSEGTAYKSIKQAEAQGLVITRPKVGTVRINLRSVNGEEISMAEAVRSIGAVCICGAEKASELTLPYVVLGDGTKRQLETTIHRAGGGVMCLVGDRPELQKRALELGSHLLLTGGALLEDELIKLAEQKKLCVFASEQDSFTLLGMLNHRLPDNFFQREMPMVRDWMQLPRYLYHDDMVTEWYRLYSDLYYRGSGCAVVDDRLKVCGSVQAMAAMNASPALRLSEIMDPPEEGSVVSEEMSMEELAELFVKGDKLFASVSNEDGMSGFIGMSDVIRYFLYNRTYRLFDHSSDNRLEISTDELDGERRVYTLQLGDMSDDVDKSRYINSIYSAAAWHAYSLLNCAVELDSGNLVTLERLTREGEYLISSNVLRRGRDEVLMELELFNEKASYARASLRYRAAAAAK